jgi:hypothetical protein
MKKKIAVHKNVARCKITEMEDTETDVRYFTAVINGWNNFRFMSLNLSPTALLEETCRKVRFIRDELDKDESFINTIGSVFIF